MCCVCEGGGREGARSPECVCVCAWEEYATRGGAGRQGAAHKLHHTAAWWWGGGRTWSRARPTNTTFFSIASISCLVLRLGGGWERRGVGCGWEARQAGRLGS